MLLDGREVKRDGGQAAEDGDEDRDLLQGEVDGADGPLVVGERAVHDPDEVPDLEGLQAFSTCVKSSSTGVARPKMETRTFTFCLSGFTSCTVAA